MRARWWLVVVIAVAVVAVGATSLRRNHASADTKSQPGSGDRRGGGPVPIVASPVTERDMPIYLRGLGSVLAYNTVTVKSRVDGELVSVNFREGDEVKVGDLLAQIDPRPFEVQLHQAEAMLARDQAQLNDAKVNDVRDQKLFQEGVIAQQQVDTQHAMVGQLEGTIGADRAQIENARLQLTYTRITAPIPGRIGLRLVDPGNIVHASDTNGLLVITQMHPIAVLFTLPEDDLQAVLKHMRGGPLPVEAYTRDDSTKIADGKLLTLNNLIDPSTGTDKLKAVFDNRDDALWPNQFVNIRLLLDVRKNALTVPTAAVLHGNQGAFAYVVKPDKSVEARPLKTGVTEGNLVAVDSGLASGELVVTDGQDKLQPGAKVEMRQPGAGGGNANAGGGFNAGGAPSGEGTGRSGGHGKGYSSERSTAAQ